jgi:N-acetylglucosaminyldiphosphoundecaprenol N-acetyl-beta-D-mannosaminyltransferase
VLTRAAGSADRPLVVVSVNLDHVYKFGLADQLPADRFEVVNLADGFPIAVAASLLERNRWPRATGSAYIDGIVRGCAADRLRVAIIGSSPEVHRAFGDRWRREFDDVPEPLYFSPTSDQLAEPSYNASLRRSLTEAGVAVVLVALGKPKQEDWIAAHGAGLAPVLLPLGAGVDFWAGVVSRAPSWVQSVGMEWAYRLALEPRRLWKRYLVQGPRALATLVRAIAQGRKTPSRRRAGS